MKGSIYAVVLMTVSLCDLPSLHAQTANESETAPVAPAENRQSLRSQERQSMEEMTVTGSRTSTALEDLALSISVVDEAELIDQLAISTNILEVLDVTVPGLSVSSSNRSGCFSNIRGRVASYQINGVPVNQELRQSNCNAMFQVSPFAIERIEVVRGATALYGAGAPGGIINLITRRAASDELEVDFAAQTALNPGHTSGTNTHDLYSGAGQSFDNWDYYAGLAYTDSGAVRTPDGGYVPGEEYESWAFNGTLGFAVSDTGRLGLTSTFYREERGQEYSPDGTQVAGERFAPVIPINDNPFKDDGYDELYTLALSYDQDNVLGHNLNLSAYLQEQTYLQRANFYDINFGGDFFFDSDTENEKSGLRSTLVRDFDLEWTDLKLSYGFDYGRNRFFRPIVDPSTDGEITGFVAPETILITEAYFIQSELEFEYWRLSAGIRHEAYSGEVGSEGYDPAISDASVPGDFEDDSLNLANLGFVYDLSDGMQLYGGISQGAEITELGRAARGINDPGRISPEPATSDQYEIGLRNQADEVEFSLAAFYSKSDKAALLQDDPSCAGEPFCPLIPLRAPQRFKGIEATVDWYASEIWTTGALLTYQRGEIYDETLGRYIDYSSERLSPTRVTLYVEFEPSESWRNRIQGNYFGEADYYSPGEEALGYVNTDSVFLMDFSSGYTLGEGEITLSLSNLLDEEYVNVRNQAFGNFAYYQEEGRRLTLGYRARY